MRLVARLDIKNAHVIKGIHLEGLRKVGDPGALAVRYYREGIDELVLMDAVASLYGRNNLFGVVEAACREVFVPLTLGGGLRSLADVERALGAGADKVAVNTQAHKTPELVREAARLFGSQCVVGSVEAKRKHGGWEAYVDNGREPTGQDALEWMARLEDLGAGEILLTSIDQEGTRHGLDLALAARAVGRVRIPVVLSGGAGTVGHVVEAAAAGVDGVALASVLHYATASVSQLKAGLAGAGVRVRP